MKGKRGDFEWDEFMPWIPAVIILFILFGGIILLKTGKLDPALDFLKHLFRSGS